MPGANLARVATPCASKPTCRFPETQAKDVEVGQLAEIDIRTAVIAARVTRKDPAATNGTVTVDVTPPSRCPKAPYRPRRGRPIQLERLEDVLYVSRPSLGQENATVGLFRLVEDGSTAERVRVIFGRASVTNVVVIEGLKEGDA